MHERIQGRGSAMSKMPNYDRHSLDNFQDQLDTAISDLEEALLGISDDDIKGELENKGYSAIAEEELKSFKVQLMETTLTRLSRTALESNSNSRDDSQSYKSARDTSPEWSEDGSDMSRSSYLKLPDTAPLLMFDLWRRPAELSQESVEDVCLWSTKARSRKNSHGLASQSGSKVRCEASRDGSPRPRHLAVSDLASLNLELPQPWELNDDVFSCQRTANKYHGSDRRFGVNSFPSTSRSVTLSERGARATFENFVRRECGKQLEAIASLSSCSNPVWIPTRPKCSPQVRYAQYKKFWEKFPVPGSTSRSDLRWAIRNKMAMREEPQKMSWWPRVKLPS